jgi:hypothetical protein
MEGSMTPRRFGPVDRNVDVTFQYHAGYDSTLFIVPTTGDHRMQVGNHEAEIVRDRPAAAERIAVD